MIEPVDIPDVTGPAEPSPPRRAGSVRRTSTIDLHWPGGWGTQLRLLGRARDLLTPAEGGDGRVLAEDVMRVGVAPDRTIEEIETEPARPGIEGLVGSRGGGRLRAALARVVPGELAAGTPLYLLLDDIAGSTLIAGFAYSQWNPEWLQAAAGKAAEARRRMEGVCTGFQPGSSALDSNGLSRPVHRTRTVLPLPRAGDPEGWHPMEDISGVSMRRARRIDVYPGEPGTFAVDAMFQDSATKPDGGRAAVHEYGLQAVIDAGTWTLVSIAAEPRVLPFVECPLATRNIAGMTGTPLAEMRTAVLDRLAKTDGCTHLNDALRALAEVPVLARALLAA
ncbi:DUF2889 domain-containing protein [Amycolatopsis sp.]|uniref:DUF2889 domain-containing protein n=1 Tax=Amycolatopsis sp. TaxID=37632 RepID=UPI002C0D9338|nr:DUF2889 domain-containing protein [Amycolatopsis sp.]HVV12699.1 DUF2889 domain-containing protein [Amycolatopsis sp.]